MRKVIGATKNVVDRTRRIPRRWAVLLSLIVIVGAGLLFVRTVLAVHKDCLFELDGNVLDEVKACPDDGDDWTTIFAGPGNSDASTGIVGDAPEPNPVGDLSIFTTGGSKDDLDTTNWLWTTGSVPDKDEILDAYAARYGDNIYFGADRFITNGTAQMGFWFFQQQVGQCTPANTTTCGPVGTFGPGQHQDGDVLVLADFTQGGAAVSIRVYKWELGGPVNGVLRLVFGQEGVPADCRDPNLSITDPACATTNPAIITSVPWAYQAKGSVPPNTIPIGGFLEGGIDLGFLNLSGTCFSSFLAETRSSAEVGAQLKDFVSHTFEQCAATMTTVPSAASVAPGTPVHDTATITGTSAGNAGPTPTGSVEFFLCSFAVGSTATCDGTTNVGVSIGTVNLPDPGPPGGVATAVSADVNTALSPKDPGHYCFRANYSGDDNYDPILDVDGLAECFEVSTVPSAITSAQTWLPNDSAELTSTGTLTGTLSFTLYDSADCTGTVLRTAQDFTLSGAGSPQSRTTTNTDVFVSTSKTVSWLVNFDSTNPAVTDSSHCEKTQLIITN
jgi:hypothetical protein